MFVQDEVNNLLQNSKFLMKKSYSSADGSLVTELFQLKTTKPKLRSKYVLVARGSKNGLADDSDSTRTNYMQIIKMITAGATEWITNANKRKALKTYGVHVKLLGKNGYFYENGGGSVGIGEGDLPDPYVKSQLIPSLTVNGETVQNVMVVMMEVNHDSIEWNTTVTDAGKKDHALITIGKLYESMKLADVELVVGGKKFLAHKALLAARSSVFDAMLAIDMNEKQLSITDFEPEVVKEFLDYLYTGKADFINYAMELLSLALKYNIPELSDLTQKFIGDNIPHFEWSELFELLRLRGRSVRILELYLMAYLHDARNMGLLQQSDEFLHVAKELYPDIFFKLYIVPY